MKKIIFALLSSTQINSALDALTEAEFTDVSLLMKDEKQARTFLDDTGPLKGVQFTSLRIALQHFHLQPTMIETYIQSLMSGNGVVAVSVAEDTVSSAKEILQDSGGKEMTVV